MESSPEKLIGQGDAEHAEDCGKLVSSETGKNQDVGHENPSDSSR